MSKEKADDDFLATLSGADVRTIMRALDFYMRICMGQLDEIEQVLRDRRTEHSYALVRKLHAALFPELGSPAASYGIAECPNHDARRAYEIFQVMRHAEAWARMPEGPTKHGPLVIFDRPHRITAKALPVVEKVEP